MEKITSLELLKELNKLEDDTEFYFQEFGSSFQNMNEVEQMENRKYHIREELELLGLSEDNICSELEKLHGK